MPRLYTTVSGQLRLLRWRMHSQEDVILHFRRQNLPPGQTEEFVGDWATQPKNPNKSGIIIPN